MGTLRTLLALTVVLAHVDVAEPLVGAKNAVQMFYVMSGFLMSYVLVESKAYVTARDFYVNRYLRLYPIYFVVGLCTFVVLSFARHSEFLEVYRRAPMGANLFLATVNLLLFGQDWVHFLAIEGGQIAFSLNFNNSEVVLYRGLLVPQAWTIGLELSFYLIAPFVLPRRRALAMALLVSIGIRLWLLGIGLGTSDPWNYRFFPAELTFFLLGALAHQVLLPRYRLVFGNRLQRVAAVVTSFMIALTLAYPWLPIGAGIKESLLFAIFIVVVPMAFVCQGETAVDRWIGELSYPIYINHLLVITIVAAAGRLWGFGQNLFICTTVVVSIACAVLLNRYVAAPIERIRRRFRSPATARLGTQSDSGGSPVTVPVAGHV
jgi:peptidoglycan/LPS O-acetylase OafA/YrhL